MLFTERKLLLPSHVLHAACSFGGSYAAAASSAAASACGEAATAVRNSPRSHDAFVLSPSFHLSHTAAQSRQSCSSQSRKGTLSARCRPCQWHQHLLPPAGAAKASPSRHNAAVICHTPLLFLLHRSSVDTRSAWAASRCNSPAAALASSSSGGAPTQPPRDTPTPVPSLPPPPVSAQLGRCGL